MEENKVKIEELKETPKRVPKKPELSPEHFESRQRAHDLKVAKFLAGGEF